LKEHTQISWSTYPLCQNRLTGANAMALDNKGASFLPQTTRKHFLTHDQYIFY